MAALYLVASAGAGVAAVLAWNWLAPVAPRLGLAVCDPIREDWEEVGKTPGGRVNRESFKVRAPLPLPAASHPGARFLAEALPREARLQAHARLDKGLHTVP